MRNKKTGTKKTVFSSKSNPNNELGKPVKSKNGTDSNNKFMKNSIGNHNESTGKMVVKARKL